MKYLGIKIGINGMVRSAEVCDDLKDLKRISEEYGGSGHVLFYRWDGNETSELTEEEGQKVWQL